MTNSNNTDLFDSFFRRADLDGDGQISGAEAVGFFQGSGLPTHVLAQVEELEKEILDSRQKIEFYSVKMQELILYKSRCDNRLNEVTARVSTDKHEEKKMDLYRMITCSLPLDLSLGRQPGIQEAAADWDEGWDKFDNKALSLNLIKALMTFRSGFTFVKELTLDVRNVVASPKQKTSFPKETTSTDKDSIANDGGGTEAVHSGDIIVEPGWGTFDDTHYDTESAWGFYSVSGKKTDWIDLILFLQSMDFSIGELDSVPSTPAYNPQNAFADSVPSTPAYNTGKSPVSFADSIPSTPAYNFGNSPRRFSEGSEDHSFDSFSSGFFQSSDNSLARFDSSVRGSKDFDNSHGFPSFDDTDPFGSSGPFRTSLESETPKGSSDNWRAF
ncbi:hypothetical protein D5086_014951 [Populus alba]|uniref:Uncharacterized protein n=1 Tax=Populus alba TaxID=43335 RepID=A0ACC4BZQ6_POPAL